MGAGRGGSLLIPTGTLASLIWMHLVGRRIAVTWRDYVAVAWVVIPPSLAAAALGLWAWGALVWPR